MKARLLLVRQLGMILWTKSVVGMRVDCSTAVCVWEYWCNFFGGGHETEGRRALIALGKLDATNFLNQARQASARNIPFRVAVREVECRLLSSNIAPEDMPKPNSKKAKKASMV